MTLALFINVLIIIIIIIEYFTFLKNKGGILSGPEDRFGFNLFIAATTPLSEKTTVSIVVLNVGLWQTGMYPLSITLTET